jgi:hypothetical protein
MMFGIVACEVCNATVKAIAVMPGIAAMVSKGGASKFGDPAAPLSSA